MKKPSSTLLNSTSLSSVKNRIIKDIFEIGLNYQWSHKYKIGRKNTYLTAPQKSSCFITMVFTVISTFISWCNSKDYTVSVKAKETTKEIQKGSRLFKEKNLTAEARSVFATLLFESLVLYVFMMCHKTRFIRCHDKKKVRWN